MSGNSPAESRIASPISKASEQLNMALQSVALPSDAATISEWRMGAIAAFRALPSATYRAEREMFGTSTLREVQKSSASASERLDEVKRGPRASVLIFFDILGGLRLIFFPEGLQEHLGALSFFRVRRSTFGAGARMGKRAPKAR